MTTSIIKARATEEPSRRDKYPVLVSQMKKRIESGDLKPGDRLPSFAEMRQQFNVGPNTVNRAFITLEQDGLIVRAQGRGVFVAEPQRVLQRHALGLAGMDLNGTNAPYWVHLIEGIQSAAHRADKGLALLHPSLQRGLDGVDGILIHGEAHAEACRHLPDEIPRVALMVSYPDIPSVIANDFQGMEKAVEHLLALGHRRIAYLAMIDSRPIVQSRVTGYQSALVRNGIAPDARWVRGLRQTGGSPFYEMGRINMREWIADDWYSLGCTALLVQNDRIAIGAMQGLREANLQVPNDVSVVGFDSTEECENVTPRLTSVEVPLQRIGITAVELLLQVIEGDRAAREAATVMLPTRLEVRDSTAPPADRRMRSKAKKVKLV